MPVTYEQIIGAEAHRLLMLRLCLSGDTEGGYSPSDFEDICQQARVKVVLLRSRIDRGPRSQAYCRQIVRNEMRDWLRSQSRHEHQALPIML